MISDDPHDYLGNLGPATLGTELCVNRYLQDSVLDTSR